MNERRLCTGTWCPVAALVCLVVLSCAQRTAEVQKSPAHVLTWNRGPDRNECKIVANGKVLGEGRHGLQELQSLDLSAGADVVIRIPDGDNPLAPGYILPIRHSYFLYQCIEKGGNIRIIHRKEEMVVHVLTWELPDIRSEEPEKDIVILFDGHSVGKGKEAIGRLKDRRLKRGAWVLVIYPFIVGHAGPWICPPFGEDEFLWGWEKNGVIVQTVAELDP